MGAVNSMLWLGYLWLVCSIFAPLLTLPPTPGTAMVSASLRQDGAEEVRRALSERMKPKSGPFMFPVLRCQGMRR